MGRLKLSLVRGCRFCTTLDLAPLQGLQTSIGYQKLRSNQKNQCKGLSVRVRETENVYAQEK